MAGARRRREQHILAVVRRDGFASIEALARELAVTPQTIRRDVNALCRDARLMRTHGGATLPSSVQNLAYSARQGLCLEEKRRIALAAAARIPDQASLFLNIGTTTEAVAQALGSHKQLRVITNNLNVAGALSSREDFEVIVAGGLVRPRDRGIVGEATIDLIRQFKVDIGVIGISGIDSDGELLDFDYREVRVAQAIIAQSRQVLLVADHTKFGRSAMVRLGSVAQIDLLVTDRAPPPAYRARLAEAGVELLVAD